ncbi:Gcd10p family-domain-containing protein [Absidia repens]|uniref:tRNA (adenine(58)-N(1))-methyltransferase non-catalytic subunit TRM6 n=1 Tax=Absidia repens TaxID=90262 RepID=A0A1X2I3L9_9FUNG|nr:Gcd10p family-domain-containing protein [Absidia repens]
METPSKKEVSPTIDENSSIKEEIEQDVPHICKNQYLLISMPSGNVKMLNIKEDTTVNLGKFGSFKSNNLIDQPFGLSYEIYDTNGSIRPIKNVALEAVEETKANNQNIVDSRLVQSLTHEEVEKLKQAGISGSLKSQEIIQRLMESHTEFDKKTEYSKFKYIERKKKKFMKMFTPLRPTLSTIANYFFTKNPDKINFLRLDTLSQLLNKANVRANSKLLIVDDTQGLIVAAAAERMGGYGTIVGVHDGDNHNFDVVRYMNFPKRIQNTIHPIPLARLDANDPNETWTDRTEEEYKAMTEEVAKSFARRKRALEERNHARDLLFQGDFDGLIISSFYKPETVIETLLPYLSGSRPVVVYSHMKEFLVDGAQYMRKSKDFIEADITESFLRQYQVLPGRTHPEMTMSAGGGYLLSGIRIIDCPFDPSLVVKDDNGRRSKKRKNKSQPGTASESSSAAATPTATENKDTPTSS